MGNLLTRRRFLKTAALGAVGIAAIPQFLSSCKSKGLAEEGVIRMGFIGLGQQAMYLLNGFISITGVEVVAGCDIYGIKRDRFLKRVNAHYSDQEKKVEVEVYENYKDLIA